MRNNTSHKRVLSNKIPKSFSQKKLLNINNQKENKINEKKLNPKNQNNIINNSIKNNNEIDINMFLESENDTYENLKIKNSKLRILIIQASNKLTEISNKYKEREINYQDEKKEILKQLDKISVNYKIYAESHQQISKIKNDYNNLFQKFEQNLKVISNYQNDIIYLLSSYIKINYNISNFLNDYYNGNINNIRIDSNIFIEKLKNYIEENIIKFNNKIDNVNFPNFYNEYYNCLEKIQIEKKIKEKEYKNKKKNVKIRKKEYINNNNFSNINDNIPNNITYSNNLNQYLNESELNYGKDNNNKNNYESYINGDPEFNNNKINNNKNNNKNHFNRELLFNKKNTMRNNMNSNYYENIEIPLNQNKSFD